MRPVRHRRSTLRFTGRLPTERALARYSSWRYAFDEEGRPGQDESTLRPDDDQRRMGPDTACTAAHAIAPDGTTYVALMSADAQLHESPKQVQQLRIHHDDGPYDVDLVRGFWWPADRSPALRYFDLDMLPLRVASVLPSAASRERHYLTLMPDGTVRFGPASQRVRYTPPPILRPSDLPAGPRDHLIDRANVTTYDVRRGARKEIGGGYVVVNRARGGMLRIRGRYRESGPGRDDLDISQDVLLDAASLELRSMTVRSNGKTRSYSRTARGRSKVPRGVFGDEELVAQCLTFSRGRAVVVPVFVWLGSYIQNCLIQAETREAAPGHPGSSAWRVRLDMYGVNDTRVWIDARTGRVLARSRRTKRRATDLHDLTIVRYAKPVRWPRG